MAATPSSSPRGSTSRRLRSLGWLLALPALLACPRGDVGAPCNHGDVQPPESKLVTFPALSCNDLLCIYADEEEPPAEPCQDDLDCNLDEPKFECARDNANDPSGNCQLRIDYVLERSMCSRKCSTDDDCKDGGVGDKIVADNSSCATGFECARIQSLGKFCCEKLCVCKDDLGVTDTLDSKCSAGTQEGCCDQEMVPEACGKQ